MNTNTDSSSILQGYCTVPWKNKADLHENLCVNRTVLIFPQPGFLGDLRLRPNQFSIGQCAIIASSKEMATRFAKIKRISQTEWSVL